MSRLEAHLAIEDIPPLVAQLLQTGTAASHLHVLRCSSCRAAVLDSLPSAAGREDVYEEVLDRVEAAASGLVHQVLQEQREAPALWDELKGLSVADRRERIATSSRYHTMALAELLEAQGEAARRRDLAQSEESLLLALGIADHLPAPAGRRMAADDLRARLHTGLGETWRRAGSLDMAEEAFFQVPRFLRALPVLDSNARFCWLLGRLRMDQGRRDEAEALYRRAAALYGELGEPESAGRVHADLRLRSLGLGEDGFSGYEPAAVQEAIERLSEALLQEQP